MGTATQRGTHHRPKHSVFPRKMGRFINLEGGLYGQLDMVAITPDQLELQTGEDFIRFDREQATNLRDTVDKFLALRGHPAGEAVEEEERLEAAEAVAAAVVVEEEQAATRERRPRRRKP